jgi:hypothetical protein
MLGSLVAMPKPTFDPDNSQTSSLTLAGMSLSLQHCVAVLIINQRDKHHPTGVSFNKARTFKLKSMKNPRTKVGPALSTPPLKVHRADIRRSLELEDHAAAGDSCDGFPLQTRDSSRRHTVASPDGGSLNWSASNASNARHELNPHMTAETNAPLVGHSSMDHVGFHTGQGIGASHLDFEELAFPREIPMNDLVYDVTAGIACSQVTKHRSRVPSTAGSCGELNPMLQSDDDGHYDVLRTIQRIAEGRMSSGGLSTSMKLYIAGILERKRIEETAYEMSDSSKGARSTNVQALIDRIISQEDALFLDNSALAGQDHEQLLNGHTLVSNEHNSLRMSSGSIEGIFAVALGRKFAAPHEGKLVTESCDGDIPILLQPTLSSSDRNKHEHLYPIDVESCLRIMPGVADLSRTSSSILGETEDSWGFSFDGIGSSDGAQTLQNHNSTLSDLTQIVDRGIPTVGELSYLTNSGYGAFPSARIALSSVAGRHHDFPAVLSVQGPVLSHDMRDQDRYLGIRH